jgi:hypothetical protein
MIKRTTWIADWALPPRIGKGQLLPVFAPPAAINCGIQRMQLDKHGLYLVNVSRVCRVYMDVHVCAVLITRGV